MEIIEKLGKLKVYFAKTYFYLGEFVKGNIEIITDKISIISQIIIEIYVIESWKVKEKEDEEPKKMNNKKKIVKYLPYLNKIKNFKITDSGLVLPIGKNLIPFDFRFSEEFNPIFEYPLPSKRAYIRYQFCVYVETSNGNYNSSFFLCLISRPIINIDKILTKSISMHIKKWKMFDKGETIFKVSIPENNYKYDSVCKVTIDIDNTNGKVNTKEYKIKLVRKITFKDNTDNIKYIDECIIIRDAKPSVVTIGQTGKFEYELTFKEKNTDRYNYSGEPNPYKNQLENINFFMPTVHGAIISCDYEIKVTLYFDCFVAFADRPRIVIPVYLVHQSPMDYQLEIQEQIEYENALKNSIDQSQKEKIENERKEKEEENIISNSIDNKMPKNDDNIKNDDINFNLINNIDNEFTTNNTKDNKLEKNKNIIDNKEHINNSNLKDNKLEIKTNTNTSNGNDEIKNNIENNSDEDDEDDDDDEDDNVPSLDLINKAKEEKKKKLNSLNQINNKNDKIPPSNFKNISVPPKEKNDLNVVNNNFSKKKQSDADNFSLFD